MDYIDSRDDLMWQSGRLDFNAGAVAVRHAMETRDWEVAASLEPLEAVEKAGGNDESRNIVAMRYWSRDSGRTR